MKYFTSLMIILFTCSFQLDDPCNRDSHTDQFKCAFKGKVKVAHTSIYLDNKLMCSILEAYDTSGYITYVKTSGSRGETSTQYTPSTASAEIKVISKTGQDIEVQNCTFLNDSLMECITENKRTKKIHKVSKLYNTLKMPKVVHSKLSSNEEDTYRRTTEKDQIKYYYYTKKNEEDSTCVINQYLNKKVLSYSSKNKYLKYDVNGNCTSYTSKVCFYSSYGVQAYVYKITRTFSYYQ